MYLTVLYTTNLPTGSMHQYVTLLLNPGVLYSYLFHRSFLLITYCEKTYSDFWQWTNSLNLSRCHEKKNHALFPLAPSHFCERNLTNHINCYGNTHLSNHIFSTYFCFFRPHITFFRWVFHLMLSIVCVILHKMTIFLYLLLVYYCLYYFNDKMLPWSV